MDKKEHKDGLEDLFQLFSELENEAILVQDWNTPSDAVWDGISERMKDQPKGAFTLVFRPAFVLMFFLLLMVPPQICFNYKGPIAYELVRTVDPIQEEVKTKPLAQAQIMGSTIEKIEKQRSLKPSDESRVEWDHPKQDKLLPQIEELEQKLVLSSNSSVHPATRILSEILPPRSIPSVNIDPIPSIKNQVASLTDPILEHKASITIQKQNPPGFYYALAYAPTWKNQKTVGVSSAPIRSFQRKASSYSTGLRLGIKLGNNWSIESGLDYQFYRGEAQHNRRILYSQWQERRNQAGDFESIHQFSLPTTSGDVETDMLMTREASSPVPEGSPIKLQINTAHRTNSLLLPLFLKYHLNFDRWRLGLITGVQASIMTSSEFTIKSIQIQDFDLMPQFTPVQHPSPNHQSKSITFQYALGAGLAYSINSHWSFAIEPVLIKGIKPVIRNNNQQVSLEATRLQVGLTHSF